MASRMRRGVPAGRRCDRRDAVAVPRRLAPGTAPTATRSWPPGTACTATAPPKQLLRQIVLAVRTYRPEVVLTDSPRSDNGIDSLTAEAVKEAFRQAGDPSVFPEQLSSLGLQAHKAEKALRPVDDRRRRPGPSRSHGRQSGPGLDGARIHCRPGGAAVARLPADRAALQAAGRRPARGRDAPRPDAGHLAGAGRHGPADDSSRSGDVAQRR